MHPLQLPNLRPPPVWLQALHQGLPPFCWNCHRLLFFRASFEATYPFLCEDCAQALPWMENIPHCQRCAMPTAEPDKQACAYCLGQSWYLDQSCSVFAYEGTVQEWVVQFKLQYKESLAPMLGKLLALQFMTLSNRKQLHGLLPIPLHKHQLRQRGFNQSILLAHFLNQNLKKASRPPVLKNLKRVRNTYPQTRLSEPDRKANIQQAFQVLGRVDGLHLLLIDDVMTSGATLNEAAQTLKAAGAQTVSALVLARTIPDVYDEQS